MIDTTYLHIGLDKTGSTAIQSACYENRSKLAEWGFLYPLDRWHGQLGSVWAAHPEDYFFNIASGRATLSLEIVRAQDAKYLETLTSEIVGSSCKKLILSYEGFPELGVEALIGMREFLRPLSKMVKVILYCREPVSYATSAISQIAKTGLDTAPPPMVHAYREICEKFSSVFGRQNLLVRRFDRAHLLNGDVRVDFLKLVGVGRKNIDSLALKAVSGNASLSAEAIAISRAIVNLEGGAGDTMHAFDARYARLLEQIDGDKYQLTPDQLEYVLNNSKPHVDYLLENFGVDIRPESNARKEWQRASFGAPFVESIARLLRTFTENAHSAARANIDEIALLEREVSSVAISIARTSLDSTAPYQRGDLISFTTEFIAGRAIENVVIGIHIFDAKLRWVFGTNSSMLGSALFQFDEGSHAVTFFLIAELPVGHYTIGVSLNEGAGENSHELLWRGKVCEFDIATLNPLTSVGYVNLPTAVMSRQIKR